MIKLLEFHITEYPTIEVCIFKEDDEYIFFVAKRNVISPWTNTANPQIGSDAVWIIMEKLW